MIKRLVEEKRIELQQPPESREGLGCLEHVAPFSPLAPLAKPQPVYHPPPHLRIARKPSPSTAESAPSLRVPPSSSSNKRDARIQSRDGSHRPFDDYQPLLSGAGTSNKTTGSRPLSVAQSGSQSQSFHAIGGHNSSREDWSLLAQVFQVLEDVRRSITDLSTHQNIFSWPLLGDRSTESNGSNPSRPAPLPPLQVSQYFLSDADSTRLSDSILVEYTDLLSSTIQINKKRRKQNPNNNIINNSISNGIPNDGSHQQDKKHEDEEEREEDEDEDEEREG